MAKVARMSEAAFAKASAASLTLTRRSFSADGRHAGKTAPDFAALIRATLDVGKKLSSNYIGGEQRATPAPHKANTRQSHALG
jgi:hypothetical protein